MARDHKRVYSTDEYIEMLGSGLADEISFVGMVKPGNGKGMLSFAHPSSCEHWVDLPTAHIAHVEHLGTTGCGDHRHAVARVTFDDHIDDAPAGLFLKLAKLHHDIAARAAIGGTAGCPMCYDKDRGWHCC